VCSSDLVSEGRLTVDASHPGSADRGSGSLPALELLVKVLGPDRLLVGNDQPPVWFPLGESLALLERLPLSEADREAVCWGNAARLFGLEPQA